MAVGKGVANAGKINRKVVGPSLSVIKGAALNEDAGVIALVNKNLVLSCLVA